MPLIVGQACRPTLRQKRWAARLSCMVSLLERKPHFLFRKIRASISLSPREMSG